MLIERNFTLSDFADLAGHSFVVRPHPEIRGPEEAWEVTLELIEAKDQTVRCGGVEQGAARDPFSVLFRGSADMVLPNRVCRFSHEALGEFDLFITPVLPGREHTPSTDVVFYESVFN